LSLSSAASFAAVQGDFVMKSLFLVSALLVSSAAIAQTTTDPAAYPTTTAAPMEQTVAPGNTNPERDARGIAVISDPASAPAGFNQQPGVGGPTADPSLPPPSQPATENYPACSRTVTDNCVQAYERGRSPRG
jgi:translation initiation factor IF-2/pilus assembly protein FimV